MPNLPEDFVRNDLVNVLTTGTLISANKPSRERVDLLIRNLDAANYITVSITSVGSTTADQYGIVLRPYDVICFSSSGTSYTCPQGAVNAIANTGACNVAVFERYI